MYNNIHKKEKTAEESLKSAKKKQPRNLMTKKARLMDWEQNLKNQNIDTHTQIIAHGWTHSDCYCTLPEQV